jgi:hypothetical protein
VRHKIGSLDDNQMLVENISTSLKYITSNVNIRSHFENLSFNSWIRNLATSSPNVSHELKLQEKLAST